MSDKSKLSEVVINSHKTYMVIEKENNKFIFVSYKKNSSYILLNSIKVKHLLKKIYKQDRF